MLADILHIFGCFTKNEVLTNLFFCHLCEAMYIQKNLAIGHHWIFAWQKWSKKHAVHRFKGTSSVETLEENFNKVQE